MGNRQTYSVNGTYNEETTGSVDPVNLRHKLSTNQDCVIALVGDSTGNDLFLEWFGLAVKALATDYPNMQVTHELWDDTAQAYGIPLVIQEGKTTQSNVTVIDTFTRTVDPLSGSTPDTGANWTAGSGATDGSKYVHTGTTDPQITHGIEALADEGIRIDLTVTIPANTATNSIFRFHIIEGTGSNQFYGQLSLSGTNRVTLGLTKRFGGTVTDLGEAVWFTSEATVDRTFDVSLIVIDGVARMQATHNGEFRAREGVHGLPTSWSINGAANRNLIVDVTDTAQNWTLDSLTIGEPSTPIATLRVLNGSEPGEQISYFLTRVALVVPAAPDLFIVSSSHNHSTQTVTDYQAELSSLISLVKAEQPATDTVAISSQNPQFSPVTQVNIDAHLERIRSLNAYCATNGFGYIKTAESFLVRSDLGAGLTDPDGVHPLTTGSELWRDQALAYLRAN